MAHAPPQRTSTARAVGDVNTSQLPEQEHAQARNLPADLAHPNRPNVGADLSPTFLDAMGIELEMELDGHEGSRAETAAEAEAEGDGGNPREGEGEGALRGMGAEGAEGAGRAWDAVGAVGVALAVGELGESLCTAAAAHHRIGTWHPRQCSASLNTFNILPSTTRSTCSTCSTCSTSTLSNSHSLHTTSTLISTPHSAHDNAHDLAHATTSPFDPFPVPLPRRRNPAHPVLEPILTGSGAGLYTTSPMSSPRMQSAVGGGGGGAAGSSTPDHDSYTSALSPTVASFEDGPGAAFSAFHRRRMSNPTRRRSSLIQEPMFAPDPRLTSSARRSSNGQPPPSPSSGSSAMDWLGARRALATQQERKRSKSDDEREPEDAALVHSTASPPSKSLHPRHAPTDPQLANNELPDRLFLPSRTHGVSIPSVLSPIPVSATASATSATPSELLPLPKDPNHILPLSTPPPSFRESLDYVGHASSGHGSTPRTSMSMSEEMSWGTGNRSYSDSSAGDDDDSPTATSGWWWRAHGRPPIMRPMLRQAPSRLPIGTRRWGWLLAPFKQLIASHDYTPLMNGSRQRGGYDREKIYPTTTRRKPRTVMGSEYLAQAVDFVQAEPWAVVLFLLVFAIFGICLGCSIKYVLDPDKAALPWREYASQDFPTIFSIQDADWDNSALGGYLPPLSVLKPVSAHHDLWPYPGYDYAPHKENLHGGPRVDSLEPTTIYVAIFTYDVGVDRRNLIRQSYASHPRSRTPGTEGVRLRFVMGRPRPQFKHMVDAEMEEYEDIVVLDMDENMNEGKTHKFFSWAADNATVPDYEYPSHPRSAASAQEFEALRAAGQEPAPIYRGEKKPDYIAKADDDAFIMLGEFERHLRVTPRTKTYWGYLVRERFMAGECYALSRDLAEYIRDREELRAHVHGKEDKLVSKWLRTHPDKEQILWFSERTWIYDHPKAGTVYSHGFLFPNEVMRVRTERAHGLPAEAEVQRHQFQASVDAYSSVSQFGTHYRPPLRGLSFDEATEALVEGSPMSHLRSEAAAVHAHTRADMAERVDALLAARPTFAQRYLGDPAERGGTILVHYIKRRSWFDETRRALLGEN